MSSCAEQLPVILAVGVFRNLEVVHGVVDEPERGQCFGGVEGIKVVLVEAKSFGYHPQEVHGNVIHEAVIPLHSLSELV